MPKKGYKQPEYIRLKHVRNGEKNPNWRGGLVRCVCKTCLNIFYRKQKDIKKGGGKFCSHKCKWNNGDWKKNQREIINKHRKDIQYGDANPNWKGGDIKNECLHCYKIVSRKRNKVARSNGKPYYCSAKCRYAAGAGHVQYSKRRSGASHHLWAGGKSKGKYPFYWTETLKRSIRERDEYNCQICGIPQGKNAHDIHHIDYVKENCDPINLITLCRQCHVKTNTKRDMWLMYFKEKICKQ